MAKRIVAVEAIVLAAMLAWWMETRGLWDRFVEAYHTNQIVHSAAYGAAMAFWWWLIFVIALPRWDRARRARLARQKEYRAGLPQSPPTLDEPDPIRGLLAAPPSQECPSLSEEE